MHRSVSAAYLCHSRQVLYFSMSVSGKFLPAMQTYSVRVPALLFRLPTVVPAKYPVRKFFLYACLLLLSLTGRNGFLP